MCPSQCRHIFCRLCMLSLNRYSTETFDGQTLCDAQMIQGSGFSLIGKMPPNRQPLRQSISINSVIRPLSFGRITVLKLTFGVLECLLLTVLGVLRASLVIYETWG